MFYQADEIKDILQCMICGFNFKDPRIVPCGETYCNMCIKEVARGGVFNCPCCKCDHQLPECNEFPTSRRIHKLMEKKPDEIDHDPLVKELKESLKEINAKIEQFGAKIKRPIDVIEEVCSNLRNEIDLATETKIAALNNHRDELFAQVAEYQKECIENIKTKDTNIDDWVEFIHEVDQFCRHMENCLKKFKIDKDTITNWIKGCDQKLTLIAEKSSEINKRILNNRTLRFKKGSSITNSSIQVGQLTFDDPDGSSEADGPYKISLKDLNPNLQDLHKLSVEYLCDDKYLIAFLSGRYLSAVIIKEDGSIVKYFPELYHTNTFHTCFSDGHLFIRVMDIERWIDDWAIGKDFFILCLDTELKIVKKTLQKDLFKGEFISMLSDESKMYLLFEDQSKIVVNVYGNHSLEKVQKSYFISCANSADIPYLISKPITTISNGFIYALVHKNTYYYVYLFDSNVGTYLTAFSSGFSSESLTVINQEVVLFNQAKQMLTVFDRKRKPREIKLHFNSNVSRMIYKKKRMFFLDEKNLTLIIK